MSLQIALLRRAQTLIEQYFGGTQLLRHQLDFVGFAAADKQCCVWRPSFAGHPRHWFQSGAGREQAQFLQTTVKVGQAKINADQYG